MNKSPYFKAQVPARAALYVAIYPMLQQIAKEHGYALAAHGSAHRDLDLIAVPWIEEASDALTLVKAMKEATASVSHADHSDEHFPDCEPKDKPHGRIAYSLHFTNEGMYGGYIDLSIFGNHDNEAEKDALIETSVELGTKQAETECKLGARIVELLEKNKTLNDALERCRFYAEDRNSDAVILIVKNALKL